MHISTALWCVFWLLPRKDSLQKSPVSSSAMAHVVLLFYGIIYLVWVAYGFSSVGQLWFGFLTLERQEPVCCLKLFPGGSAYLCLNCRCPHLYNLHCLKCQYYLFLKNSARFDRVYPVIYGAALRYAILVRILKQGPVVFFPFCCLFCSLITFISATLKLMRLLGYVKENPVLIPVLISYLCIFLFLHIMCSDWVTPDDMLWWVQ